MASIRIGRQLLQPRGRLCSACASPPYRQLPAHCSLSRRYSSAKSERPTVGAALETAEAIENALATPSWSIESLLPSPDSKPENPVTPQQLRHLLRLSALPEPKDAAEEASMLSTLASQLHFLSAVRSVSTDGVAPLRAIRDETSSAQLEQEITVDKMREHLGAEDIVGTHYKRVRRRQEKAEDKETPRDWKPLEQANRTSGKFFAVDGGGSDL